MTEGRRLLELRAVSKRFSRHIALRSVDIDVDAGESVALLGANGAGKTTLQRILATLTRPSRGEYRAFEVDAWERRRDVRARIGVVGHRPFVYPELTCRENLAFYARMFSLDDPERAAGDALTRMGIGDRADQPASALSRGLLQRLDLARATLHDPAALILDEPDTGLDAPGRQVLRQLIEGQVGRGGAVVFTSHAIEFATSIATRVIVLRDGEVVLSEQAGKSPLVTIERAISSVEAREVVF